MKSSFSVTWKASKQPRKQRKYVYNAPLHTRTTLLSASLSKDLRKKHNKRTLPVRTNDKVKVVRGQFSGVIGKVVTVDRSKLRVHVEGAELVKADGSKRTYPIHPSNVVIIEATDDKKRIKAPSKQSSVKKTTAKSADKADAKKTTGVKE